MMGGDNQRLMQLSKNLVVPRWMSEDIVEDGVTYELLYAIYGNKTYRVQNILKYYKNSTRVILDIQELR